MQTLILWALLAKGGQGYARDLRPPVKAPERKALVAAGLVASEKKAKGALWLEVTDKGWAWAPEHLGDELSSGTTNGTFVLRDWLIRLQAFMRARDLSLAEILVPAADDAPQVPSPASLRECIRNAYLQVTDGTFNKRVLLSGIRAALADID